MKKHLTLEIILSAFIVFIPTIFIYKYLAKIPSFWTPHFLWSLILSLGWIIVAIGYYHQGWLVKIDHSSKNVSLLLPTSVFFIQCILFIKGINYDDWSLVWGALIVNSGVVFNLYQILKNRKF